VAARRKILAVCALGIIAAACSGGGKSSTSTPTTSPTASGSASTTAASTTTLPAANDLSKLILSTVPSGFTQQADDVADTGPTNAEKAALDDVSDKGPGLLRDAGFQHGYQRTWIGADGSDTNTILLYQFATPAGAQQWVNHWLEELRQPVKGVTISDFDVPLGSMHGFGVRGDYTDSSSGIAVFAQGPYAVQAAVHTASSNDPTPAAILLATAQNDRLPA